MPLELPKISLREDYVPSRIRAKYARYIEVYEEYEADLRAGKSTEVLRGKKTSLIGERYEIAVAVHLWNLGKLPHGREISRWSRPARPALGRSAEAPQHIKCGDNTEFDFVIKSWLFERLLSAGVPAVQGYLLGDAKTISGGYGHAIKNLLGFALYNYLAGICIIGTPSTGHLWKELVTTVYPMLASGDEMGISGNWSQRAAKGARPAGADIVRYFSRYDTLSLINGRALQTVRMINTELATYAGIYIVCYHVDATGDHEQFTKWFGNLRLY